MNVVFLYSSSIPSSYEHPSKAKLPEPPDIEQILKKMAMDSDRSHSHKSARRNAYANILVQDLQEIELKARTPIIETSSS